MAQTESQIVATELERVVPKLPTLFDREGLFYSALEKRDVEIVSNREMRIPLELRPGGKFGHFSPAGGDLGRGSGHITDKAVISPAFLKHAVEYQKLTEWATDDKRKAIVKNVQKLLTDGMKEFRRHCDSIAMTGGNGVLGTITTNTAAASSTLTFTTDGYGVRLMRYGQNVNIYNSALSGIRTNGTEVEINFYDLQNKTIKVGANLTDTAAGDFVVVSGLSGASPSSIKGVPYHHSNASTGSWLGLDRSTNPEIRANRVNGGGNALSLPEPRLAINKVGDRVGMDYMKRCQAWMHPCQSQAYEELGFLVTMINQTGENKGLDLYFGGAQKMAGAPVKNSFSWDKKRIDFIDLDVWGRAVMHEASFYEEEGRRLFEIRGASGGVAAATIFYLVAAFDIFMSNPASGSYIDNLAVPSGY